MGAREFTRGRCVVARLPHGGDLLEEIAAVADEHGMRAADLRAIGALQAARLSYYDQTTHEYGEFAVDGAVEIVSLLGTVSLREGATMVHAHATLAGHDGACVGGHVAPGCVVFACELVLQELVGEPLEREFDEVTGLALWRGL
ncbi:MAG: DNA-binding protein [Actinobacteria bacterium]|nr:DNA-binding protein [Actinomycetota bacterium]